MKHIAWICGAALALAVASCNTYPEPGMRAGPVLAENGPADAAPTSLVDICGRAGVEAFHRRLATAPPSPIANAEAALDARAAAQRCLDRATAAPRGRTWRPPD